MPEHRPRQFRDAPAHVSVDLTRRRVVITRVPRSPAN